MGHTQRLKLSLGLIAALAVALTGLIVPLAQAAPPPQAAGVVRIGYLAETETDGANGAQLAVDQINGSGGFTAADGGVYSIELITLAAPPTAEMFANSITAMMAQNVVAMIGPDTDAPLTAANVQSAINTGIPILTGAAADGLTDGDPSNVLFRIQAPNRVYSHALAAYMTADLGLTSIVLVSTDTPSAEALADFEQTLGSLGILAAGKVQLANAALLEAQGQAVLGLNPEAVVLWGPPEDAETLLRLLRNNGWNGRFAYPQADEAARAGTLPDNLAAGVLGVTSWSYAYTDQPSRVFLEDYITTFGKMPGAISAAAYDTIWLLRSVMVNQGVDAAAIQAGLLAAAPLNLVHGALRPAAFGNGDLSRGAMVYVLGDTGGPTVVAVFDDTQRLQLVDAGNP